MNRNRIEVREAARDPGQDADVVVMLRERRMQLFLTYQEMVELHRELTKELTRWDRGYRASLAIRAQEMDRGAGA